MHNGVCPAPPPSPLLSGLTAHALVQVADRGRLMVQSLGDSRYHLYLRACAGLLAPQTTQALPWGGGLDYVCQPKQI